MPGDVHCCGAMFLLPFIPLLQGLLSVDYGALLVVLLSALKKALADQRELREAQGSMQLSVVGRLQELSEAVRQLQAGMASGGGGGGGGGEGPLARAPSSASAGSLELLLDAGDVEMTSSGGEEGEAEAEAAGDFAGLSDEEAVQLLVDRLLEQPGARKLYVVSCQVARQLGWLG